MTNKCLMINSLLSRTQKGNTAPLLRFFPEELQHELENSTVPSAFPTKSLQVEQALSMIHYSWFVGSLTPIQTSLRHCILASFPKAIKDSLSVSLKESQVPIELPFITKRFFLSWFYRLWMPKDILFVEFLPETPLMALLSITKFQLVYLIDFLGLQDLASDLKRVIDKRVLDQLNTILTTPQRQYLTHCLLRSDLIAIKAETINYWLQDPKKTLSKIHQKGLIRFTQALSGQDNSFIWHVIHRLDNGRGQEILRLMPEKMPQISSKVQQQLTEQVAALAVMFTKQGTKS